MSVVLDSSALMAVLLSERGGDVVQPYLRGATISAVNISESLSRGVERGVAAAKILGEIARFELAVVPFSRQDAIQTAALRQTTKHKGLSFGDRACLALAAEMNLPVYTADTAWADLALGIDIRLIR